MSAANLHLHLLLLADQRVEHEDEGEEVEVDGQADLEEHDASPLEVNSAWLQLLTQLRLCVLGQKTLRSPPKLSGKIGPAGLFPLIGQNQMD